MTNAYALVFPLGVMAGLLWLLLGGLPRRRNPKSRREGPTPAKRVDAGLAALVGGLGGARLAFALVHWGYYAGHPAEILVFQQGGLSWVGGAVGALAGLTLYARLSHQPFWPLADALSFPVIIVAAASWFGCLLEGCAYGRPVALGPFTPPTVDMFGGRIPRWPTQAVGALYSLLLLLGLLWSAARPMRPGLLACLTVALIAGGAFALSYTRADPVSLLFNIRLDALGSAAVFVIGLAGLTYRAAGT